MHNCQRLVDIHRPDRFNRIKIYEQKNRWYICYSRFANKKEVEIGEADVEGELLLEVDFQIHYCPFCGEKLKGT